MWSNSNRASGNDISCFFLLLLLYNEKNDLQSVFMNIMLLMQLTHSSPKVLSVPLTSSDFGETSIRTADLESLTKQFR